MSTVFPSKPGIERNWHVIDADDIVLGKLVSHAARLLMGKHKASWTPFLDTGDHVIVLNAAKVKLTGKRMDQKTYYHNTLYPGGARHEKFNDLIATNPTKVIEEAVKGMLPKNSLGHDVFMKLKVYAGAEHPHEAQMPKPYALA